MISEIADEHAQLYAEGIWGMHYASGRPRQTRLNDSAILEIAKARGSEKKRKRERHMSELTAEEKQGYVSVIGQQVFCDLLEPASAKGYENAGQKFSSTIKLQKDAEGTGFDRLVDVIYHVAEEKWGAEAQEKLDAVWAGLEAGLKPNKAYVNIQDGDLHFPEYNGGCWVISAKRKAEAGQPALVTQEGVVCFDEHGELAVPIADVPQKYDGVLLVIEVWAQANQDRINFTLHVVRRVVKTPSLALAPPSPTAVNLAATAALPQSVAGVDVALQVEAGAPEAEVVDEEEETPAPKKRKGPGAAKPKVETKTVEVEVVEAEEESPKKPRTSLFRK